MGLVRAMQRRLLRGGWRRGGDAARSEALDRCGQLTSLRRVGTIPADDRVVASIGSFYFQTILSGQASTFRDVDQNDRELGSDVYLLPNLRFQFIDMRRAFFVRTELGVIWSACIAIKGKNGFDCLRWA